MREDDAELYQTPFFKKHSMDPEIAKATFGTITGAQFRRWLKHNKYRGGGSETRTMNTFILATPRTLVEDFKGCNRVTISLRQKVMRCGDVLNNDGYFLWAAQSVHAKVSWLSRYLKFHESKIRLNH